MITTGSDRTHRLATQHRRRSPPNWISNGLLRYALRAPLRSPLLQPRLCAKQPPGSNPSWGKAGGHVSGIVQLADASGLRAHLPEDLELVLQALLSYRNQILHNGLEWPLERREKFANQVANWPKGWFEKAESNHKPWVWYMSDVFIQRVLRFIDEVLEAAGQHIRLYDVPGKTVSEGELER